MNSFGTKVVLVQSLLTLTTFFHQNMEKKKKEKQTKKKKVKTWYTGYVNLIFMFLACGSLKGAHNANIVKA